MSLTADRRLRADAARNAENILRAAREVYAEDGPDAHLETVARRAGVGERTLYRRFPTKADLVRAILDQSIAENLSPAIENACQRENSLQGLVDLLEAAMSMAAREHNILAVARKVGALTDDISAPLYEALTGLMVRAQRDGLVRDDLVAEDLPRIIAMLNSILWTMEPSRDGWRRYLDLILDAISTQPPRTLPPAAPVRYVWETENWPI